tara:strand:- start:311 stop:511 length:201 start_codon:yes stop_codon:yes gene_type:complete
MMKVKGHPHLRRDLDSNSIVNVDFESYQNHKLLVEKTKEQDKKIKSIENKLDNITNLLEDLLNKNN